MGFTPKRTTHRLVFDDPSFDGLVVRTRAVTVGQSLDFEDADSGQDVIDAFAAILVDWNVTDDDGQPVPASVEGLKTLEADFLKVIMDAWKDATTQVSDPLGQRSSGGSPSAVELPPTVPLSESRAS